MRCIHRFYDSVSGDYAQCTYVAADGAARCAHHVKKRRQHEARVRAKKRAKPVVKFIPPAFLLDSSLLPKSPPGGRR